MKIFWLIYLVIFMWFLYYTCNKYKYGLNVVVYTIGRGLIPALFAYSGFANLLTLVILRFIIGLVFIKLLTMLNDYFQDVKWFLLLGIFLEAFVSRFVVAFILAFIIAL